LIPIVAAVYDRRVHLENRPRRPVIDALTF